MKNKMQIRRLGWAGLQIRSGSSSLVIDLFEDRHAMAPLLPEVSGPMPAPEGQVDFALVTHLHGDHTDPPALGRALGDGGLVLRPPAATGTDLDRAATAVAEHGLAKIDARVEVVDTWEARELGPFTVTAVPAVDGFGDPQVSWVVEAEGERILHCGDTVHHGAWWPIASRFESLDVAFLPVNGAICSFPHRQPPSSEPAALDPSRAAMAAEILGADLTVPIHYGQIDVPGIYEPTGDGAAFIEVAASRGIEARLLAPGEVL